MHGDRRSGPGAIALWLAVSLAAGWATAGCEGEEASAPGGQVGPVGPAVPMDDGEITEAVEIRLADDPATHYGPVEVEVEVGVVTLTGEVDSLLGKERAGRLAASVRGVRSVIQRIQVAPDHTPKDAQLAKELRKALMVDAATWPYGIEVAVEDGVAILTGTVDSWQARALAARVAKGVYGVVGLDNRIEVDYDTERPDDRIRTEVERALRWDALVDASLVQVTVEDAKVFLSGTLGSLAEKNRAIRDAWVAGVERVNASALAVEPWARDERIRESSRVVKTDARIEEAVEDALRIDPRVPAGQVAVEVDMGVARLHGVVDGLAARRAACRDARNTLGVVRVIDRLKVRPEDPPGDELLVARVTGALARDPLLAGEELIVTADRGVVRLAGSLPTRYLKARADEVAARVRGVVAVENDLDIDSREPLILDPIVDTWSVYDYPWYALDPPGRMEMHRDNAIRAAVHDRLRFNPFVDASQVEVEVEGGIATLQGRVDNLTERRAAVRSARRAGAIRVIDSLMVEPVAGD